MKPRPDYLARYWRHRTHAQTWRNRAQINARERQQLGEGIATAFVATLAYGLVVVLFAALALIAI